MALFENKEDIYKLLEKFDSSTATEIELETGDIKIKIKKAQEKVIFSDKSSAVANLPETTIINEQNFNNADEVNITINGESVVSENEKIVKAPLIGVYYSAPSPEAENFVSVGKKVKKGDVLCIIEAMKVMNDIDCEYDGEITEIYKKNAESVEFGAPLFKIRLC